jgi:hypothetical protein
MASSPLIYVNARPRRKAVLVPVETPGHQATALSVGLTPSKPCS